MLDSAWEEARQCVKGHHAEIRWGGRRSEEKAPDVKYVQGAVWGTRKLDNMFRKTGNRGGRAGKADRGTIWGRPHKPH